MPAAALDNLPELKDDNSLISFARSLPNDPSVLRLFERSSGDFYSAHGVSAHFIANDFYKTTTVLKHHGGLDFPSVTLNCGNLEGLLRLALFEMQLKVEIYAKERNVWILVKEASPGNLTQVEDYLFREQETHTAPVVLAARITAGNEVSVGFAEPSFAQSLGVCAFVDDELFSNLESLIIQHNVREILLEASALPSLQQSLKRLEGLVFTEVKKSSYKVEEADLRRLVNEDEHHKLKQEVLDTGRPEMKCLGCVISYLKLLQDPSTEGNMHIDTFDLSQYMKLDAAAVRALNLLPPPTQKNSFSLYSLLNKCRTAQGSRLLARFIQQPLKSIPEIEDRLNLVEIMIKDLGGRSEVQDMHLKSVPDLERLMKKFARQRAGLQDIVRLYQLSIRLPELTRCLQDMGNELILLTFKTTLDEALQKLRRLEEMVELTIDLEKANHHDFKIRADFDGSLTSLTERLNQTENQIQVEVDRVALFLNVEPYKKLKVDRDSQRGYHLRLSRNDSAILRKHRAEIIELGVVKAGVMFTTPGLRVLSADYAEMEADYESKQREIVKELVKVTATYKGVFEKIGRSLAYLDVICAFAESSTKAPTPYERPVLSPDELSLEEARHPCLEAQEGTVFIPNDAHMKRFEREFLIITGPNMGGKSTYIRQIGLIALMAQIGCYVPAKNPRLPIFDCILARVGAGDSQLRGVSTFMAEMLEMAAILKTATRESLVIVDELGRGTSTHDGFGLAYAISEHLAANVQCFTLFATHFHELTELSKTFSTVHNLQAQVTEDIQFLYKIVPGVCDQSFGIHVAKLAKFPEPVLKMAQRKAQELEGRDLDLPPEFVVDGFLADVQQLGLEDAEPGDEIFSRLKDIRGKWEERWRAGPPGMEVGM